MSIFYFARGYTKLQTSLGIFEKIVNTFGPFKSYEEAASEAEKLALQYDETFDIIAEEVVGRAIIKPKVEVVRL